MSSKQYGDWVLVGSIWYNTKTGQSMRAISGGALPATDSFTTGSDQELTVYSANWTIRQGYYNVVAASDDVIPDHKDMTVFEHCAYWDADTFNDNQYAQVSIKYAYNGAGGPAVRVSSSAVSYYLFVGDAGGSEVAKYVAGSKTALATGGSVTTNDVLYISADGTTITCKKNGSTTGCPAAQTDSSLSSGYAGFAGEGARDNRIDDFEGGNLSTGATGTLSATLAAATASATGTVQVNGSAAVTLAAATGAGTGKVQVSGTANITLGAATAAGTGKVQATGALSATLADATLAAAGTVANAPATGTLDATLEAATLSATGTNQITGTASITLGAATLAATGTVAVSGTASITLADATCSATGTVTVYGAAAVTLADATLAATATVTSAGEATGILDVTLGAATVSASGSVFSLDYLRPITDTTVGNWTTNTGASTGLYDTINEATPNDEDYAMSEVSPTSSPVVFALSVGGDAGKSIGHTMRYRYGKAITGAGETINLTVQLRQGYTNESSQGTLIAEWTHSDIGETLATAEQALTAEQADSITDYSSLFARLVAEAV